MKKILIVDDNDRYANNLNAHFTALGYNCDRAYTAREGWERYQSSKNQSMNNQSDRNLQNVSESTETQESQRGSDYEMIITDITMETQTSGLWFIRRVHKDGYMGTKIIATTGFDFWGVMAISRWILPWFAGISYMIPKVPLKQGKVVLVSVT